MGTNFYTVDGVHIGKRSAAGLYCWDCDITLCKGGNDEIHSKEDDWHNKCPKCDKKPVDEGWDGSAGRELGFNKLKYKAKTGVKTCSSFSWAMPPYEIMEMEKIIDEYGKSFELEEFLNILDECPIRFFHSIGRNFS